MLLLFFHVCLRNHRLSCGCLNAYYHKAPPISTKLLLALFSSRTSGSQSTLSSVLLLHEGFNCTGLWPVVFTVAFESLHNSLTHCQLPGSEMHWVRCPGLRWCSDDLMGIVSYQLNYQRFVYKVENACCDVS